MSAHGNGQAAAGNGGGRRAKAGKDPRQGWSPPPPPPGAAPKGRFRGNGRADDLDELLPEPDGFIGTELVGRVVIPPEFVVDQWIPAQQAVALFGKPGVGKTFLLLLLGLCLAQGIPFLGLKTKKCKVLGLFVEDIEDQLVFRFAAVCNKLNITYTGVTDFRLISYVGKIHVALVEVTREGRLRKTKQWDRLVELLEQGRPDVVILDTLADFAGFDENARNLVAMFVRMLDGLSMKYGCMFIVSAHPSRTGERERTYVSGSTGWGAKFRAYLLLVDPADLVERDDDERSLLPAASNERLLVKPKINYSRPEQLALSYHDGFFVPLAPPQPGEVPRGGAEREAACELEVLKLIPEIWKKQKRRLSDDRAAHAYYAPMLLHGAKPTFTVKEYNNAVLRLIYAERLHVKLDTAPLPDKSTSGRHPPGGGNKAIPSSRIVSNSARSQKCSTALENSQTRYVVGRRSLPVWR